MECTHKQNRDGFTLVEISIVMIIIGLLIGGTFGGMKLIENMEVNKTVQDLKAIESAAITFKDTYGRLPGDMPNTAARLPSCTDAPCATGGNGNRRINGALSWQEAITATNEKFTFWHHLQAADLLTLGTKNVTDLSFGEGQPESPIGGGYRNVGFRTGSWCMNTKAGHDMWITPDSSGSYAGSWYQNGINCRSIKSIDDKVDDGRPATGSVASGYCAPTNSCVDPNADYIYNASSALIYFTRY
jgi:prepilin-type N-terminal cleavage/methylation domain-containing protein